MRSRDLHPIRALLMLVLLLQGGVGFSAMDALLFHQRGATMPAPVHVEAQTTLCHAEHCLLSSPGLLSRVSQPGPDQPPSRPAAVPTRQAPPARGARRVPAGAPHPPQSTTHPPLVSPVG